MKEILKINKNNWKFLVKFYNKLEIGIISLYLEQKFLKIKDLWFALFNKLLKINVIQNEKELKHHLLNEFTNIFTKFDSKIALKNWFKKIKRENTIIELINTDELDLAKTELLNKWVLFRKETDNIEKEKKLRLDLKKKSLKTTQLEKKREKVKRREKIKEKVEPGKLVVLREYDYESGFIRFKVIIRNEFPFIISNITIDLELPEVVKLIKILPQECNKKQKAIIANMAPHGKQSVDFYLEPMICGQFPIEIYGHYKDPYNKHISFHREPKFIQVKCPPLITPEETTLAAVINLYENKLPEKQIRFFIIDQNAARRFQIAYEAITNWGGKKVGEQIKSEHPFDGITYFFRITKNLVPQINHREQIVIRLRINEINKVGEIQIRCELQETAIGILAKVWELILQRFKQTFGIQLYSKSCPDCGAPITNINFKDNKYQCSYCKKVFSVN